MICVVGAGAFGTALAISLAANGPVILWTHDADHAAAMREARENARRLPGIVLPEGITITADFDTLPAEIPVLLAVPMQQLRGMLETHAKALRGHPLIACCKGIELSTGSGPTAILSETLPGATSAILTGPSFAADIARGLPTALTLACADAAMGRHLQQALTTPNLRLYRSTDTIGAELGGALKNVIAIGAGAVMGAGLGASARAALMTRGNAEIARLATALGAQAETLSGLSGFGDLVLTCTSDASRNYRFGHALGAGTLFDPNVTVEGAATARAALTRAQAMGLDLPVTAAVVALLDQPDSLPQVMETLLSRPLKEE